MYIGIYMKFLELKGTDPYQNLAIEEYVFENCEEETFILWQNEPCVVFGKNQNPYVEVMIDLCKNKNIKLVRRITGGGCVYHDLGNVNYSFISPDRPEGIDFEYFTKPIVSALNSIGVNCKLSGRNDLLLDNGRKISGNAQHSKNNRVLHHGTLLFDSDLDVLSELLNVDPEKLQSKAIRSAKSRVANIKDFCGGCPTVDKFKEHLKNAIISAFDAEEILAPDNDDIRKLYLRNSSEEWIFDPKSFLSIYNIIRKKRFDFGTVEMNLTVSRDVIRSARIVGDFFEKKAISEFEEKLIGRDVSAIADSSDLDISDYILGMGREDLAILLS